MTKSFSDFINEDVGSIERDVVSFFKKDRRAEVRKDSVPSGSFYKDVKFMYSIRYWGDWEVPEYEEDDGDYDWEVLKDKSRKELSKFEKDLNSKYKKNKIFISPEEKNYISVTVK